MKKGLIITLAVVGVILLVGLGFIGWANGKYDKAVAYQEQTKKSWGNVQAAYQRRADLVPQLVATVKASAENEQKILTQVTQARAGIVGAQSPQDLELAGRKINTAINLAFEAYPEIRSTANFATLQSQLEGTENRINVERVKYNEEVSRYNTFIRGKFRQFAINIMDDMANFPQKDAFETITENADKAPDVGAMFDK